MSPFIWEASLGEICFCSPCVSVCLGLMVCSPGHAVHWPCERAQHRALRHPVRAERSPSSTGWLVLVFPADNWNGPQRMAFFAWVLLCGTSWCEYSPSDLALCPVDGVWLMRVVLGDTSPRNVPEWDFWAPGAHAHVQ